MESKLFIYGPGSIFETRGDAERHAKDIGESSPRVMSITKWERLMDVRSILGKADEIAN